jgi:CRP-like cAMP-binding protein
MAKDARDGNDANAHLRAVPLFSDFTRDDFDHVLSIATELQVSAGQVLMEEGALGHEMVIVLEGSLEVLRDGVHVADVAVGGFAGEMALLRHRRRNSTVVAKEDSTVLQIDGRGLDELLHAVPLLAVKMLPVVANRVAPDDD